ncbi:hypothetical protein [Candidatus Odyssella thessalonicensis]|uniref:hypothetical protein n=1 Tax=Candidatus Odyssella thessalonicensis TaxID=84647 RepID=UPI000225B243|nr:hypothetical protein [Candidatus Odyssella thessalonicensis]
MDKENIIILEDNDIITAIFKAPIEAENVYRRLLDIGYDKEKINLIMSEAVHGKYFSNSSEESSYNMGSKSMEGLGIGAVAGGAIGGIAAALAAIGTTLVFPALGLTISGPLAAGLAGAGAGSTTGGLIGALVGWGFPNEKAKILEEEINNGGVGIVIRVDKTITRDMLLNNLRKPLLPEERLSA